MRETWVRSLGREDPLEKDMATHSSILAWKIPWMEEAGGLQSVGSQRVGHDWVTSPSFTMVSVQYCSLQHQTLLPSTVTFATGRCFFYGCVSSFFLELFLYCSLVAYWSPTDLGSSSFSSYLFAFSWCSWGSQGKNTEVICHSLLQWITFCQTSPHDLPILGGPTRHGLVPLS